MNDQNLTVSFSVDATPKQVFDAVNNVSGWWGTGIEGSTSQLNDEFIFRHKDMHYSKHKLTEVIPNKKVVWLTTDSSLNFLQNKTEWNGTEISFEIEELDGKTHLRFTHWGLTPESECFEACTKGWGRFVQQSLYNLITTGQGTPA